MSFFFKHTATTEIYTLSLHDALPISDEIVEPVERIVGNGSLASTDRAATLIFGGQRGNSLVHMLISRSSDARSEEHTSELQSQSNLVCRLLLEKKKKKTIPKSKNRNV